MPRLNEWARRPGTAADKSPLLERNTAVHVEAEAGHWGRAKAGVISMGLLDQMLGGNRAAINAQKPGLGSTVAAGVVLALLVKGVRSYQASQEVKASQSAPISEGTKAPPVPSLGGLGGLLSGAGGIGGLLGGLGGAGALGALITQLQKGGLADHVSSWISHGQNAQVSPDRLGQALGESHVDELEQQTGLPRQQLLSELADELPHAIDQLSPQGRLPDDGEIASMAQGGSQAVPNQQ